MTTERLNSIDARLERLVAGGEQQARNIAALSGKIDALTDQIGRLTESQTDFRTELAELRATAQRQAETAELQEQNFRRLAETTEHQDHNIERLAQTTERQDHNIERQAQTAERQERNIEQLAETTERQSRIVEQLLSDRHNQQ